ncbi:MAG: 2,3-bisphosphoglycerate-independent phosphoglycerate mutase [Patescibacteria group bacterium]|nr:2,3-bisphosphoglycerate-independent phosphoglycerate mutase [Patescibacteria group bacterium]
MKKILLIIIDGLGDKPIPQLKNKTPLEAAKTPNLDFLAKKGICGLVLPYITKGELPTSEDTHLALFGFDPKIYNPGRGVLEVLGIGLKILPGDVCLRGNFATVDTRTLKIIDRRAGRIEKTESLIRAINGITIEGVKFLIGKAISHRIGIVMRNKNLSAKISDGDPKVTGGSPLRVRSLDKSKSAEFTARVLNQFLAKAHSILKEHPINKKRKLPANYILVRKGGKLKKIKGFNKKYNLKAAFVAGGTLYKGIGRFLRMREIKVKGATGLPTTNLKGKLIASKKGLKNYDFIFCHIKAADNLAEDGNFFGKKKFIEKIDKNLKPLLKLKNTLIVVTADHSTCSLLKSHCQKPIPILIYSNGRDYYPSTVFQPKSTRSKKVKKFSERDCQKGNLGKIKQIDLMPKILKLACAFDKK